MLKKKFELQVGPYPHGGLLGVGGHGEEEAGAHRDQDHGEQEEHDGAPDGKDLAQGAHALGPEIGSDAAAGVTLPEAGGLGEGPENPDDPCAGPGGLGPGRLQEGGVGFVGCEERENDGSSDGDKKDHDPHLAGQEGGNCEAEEVHDQKQMEWLS